MHKYVIKHNLNNLTLCPQMTLSQKRVKYLNMNVAMGTYRVSDQRKRCYEAVH